VYACAAASAQGLPKASPDEVGLSPAVLERIAPEMQAYIDDGRTAGMVMVVARHGKIAYARALGYADRERRTPLRLDALFRVASIRKPLLAAATMVLVESGRLRLDDPVSKYIPSFAGVQVFAGGTADHPQLVAPATPITVRHLLTHTSGLTGGYGDSPTNAIFLRTLRSGPKRTPAEYADALASIPLQFHPGTKWEYGVSFEVVARLLEVASGQPLDVFLRQQFLQPLGANTVFVHVDPAMADRVPTLYEPGPDGKLMSSARPVQDPTGMLVASPADFMRFGQMLLNDGVIDGKRVLSAQSVGELMTNQLPPALTPLTTAVWDHEGYGFGLGGGVLVGQTRPETPASPGTYRWAGATGTFWWVDREAGVVALLWTQSRTGYWLEHHFQRLVQQALLPKR
jgi:CubicO group peptidase (beta-lactamase class C family)